MPQLIESPTRIHAYGKGDKKSLYCPCVLLFAFGLIEGDRLNCLPPLYLPCFHPGYRLPYGAGTLMCLFTIVTEAFGPNALPFSVVIVTLPTVKNVTL
jgi:hypothetical protein